MHDGDFLASAVPKPRILLVEDEATPREHLGRARSDDYVVDTAGDGREALRAAMQALPELIVTDIVMPDIDGIELLKTLRSTWPNRSKLLRPPPRTASGSTDQRVLADR
jgi:DNA-binding response OmpR family regulator